MATSVPPKKNTAFVMYVGLVASASRPQFKANPTLAAGDVKVSIDGGALANLTTLPTVTPAAGRMVQVSLSAAEMNGDDITVVFSDAAGAEWDDLMIGLKTSANWLDDVPASVWAAATRTLSAFGFNVTVGTNNDKTGYALTAGEHTGIASDAQAGLTAQGYTTTRAGYLDTLSDLVAAIWSYITRTLTSFGVLTTDVWAAPARTLTSSAAQIAAAMAGSAISIRRGDTVTIALTGLGNIAARTKLWFTVKRNSSDWDSAAIVQVEESGGLLMLNGAAGAAGNASLVVNDAALGNITITLKAEATAALLPETGLSYDVQMLTATSVQTLTVASASVVADVTRAVS